MERLMLAAWLVACGGRIDAVDQGVVAPTTFCAAQDDTAPIACDCGSSTAPRTCGILATVDDDGGVSYACCLNGTGECSSGACH